MASQEIDKIITIICIKSGIILLKRGNLKEEMSEEKTLIG
jgi:hypothetical protein